MVTAALKRIPLVCGNWKLNGSKAMISELVGMLNAATLNENVQVGVSPSTIHLSLVRESLRDDIMVGAQDCWKSGSGAFTGETSADMLVDLGLEFSIVGHSERREKGEASTLVGEKAKYGISKGLTIIGCIGEQLADRESGNTMTVLEEQMAGYISNLDETDFSSLVIAYEPVWAIGTGVVATPEIAQETHYKLREFMKRNISERVALETRILYGGSVTEDNCNQLIECEDIDGFLVGGASLKPQFLNICDAPLKE